MKTYPEYNQNIIVGVIHENTFRWYVTDKEMWYLDLRKLIDEFAKKGYPVPNPNDFSSRFNIDIVNEDTANEFLNCIEEYRVETEELSNLLVNKQYDYIGDLVPSLFINFTYKLLYSLFPEPASYEHYVPDGWTGTYKDFLNYVPPNYQYWMVSSKNLLFENWPEDPYASIPSSIHLQKAKNKSTYISKTQLCFRNVFKWIHSITKCHILK